MLMRGRRQELVEVHSDCIARFGTPVIISTYALEGFLPMAIASWIVGPFTGFKRRQFP